MGGSSLSYGDPSRTIRTFLKRGADPSLKTSFGLTPHEFARRQGKHELVKALLEAGIPEEGTESVNPSPKPAGSARQAVEKALPPLQRCDVAFLEQAGCVSCHNNSLTAMTVAEARSRGIRVNEEIPRVAPENRFFPARQQRAGARKRRHSRR